MEIRYENRFIERVKFLFLQVLTVQGICFSSLSLSENSHQQWLKWFCEAGGLI